MSWFTACEWCQGPEASVYGEDDIADTDTEDDEGADDPEYDRLLTAANANDAEYNGITGGIRERLARFTDNDGDALQADFLAGRDLLEGKAEEIAKGFSSVGVALLMKTTRQTVSRSSSKVGFFTTACGFDGRHI